MRTLPLLLLLCLLPVFAVLGGCKKSDLPDHPMKVADGIELPNSSKDEEIRYVTYAQDGVTPVSARVEFRNGNTAYAVYHANGKVKDWQEFYPAGPDGKRQMRLKVILSDKEHYKSDTLYRDDGTLAREGREVNRAYYEANWYYEDGKTVSRHKQIKLDSDKTLLFDEKFRPTGTLLSQMRLHPDGKMVTTSFSETGLPTTRWTTSKVYGYGALFEQFYPDGVTVRIKGEYQALTTYVEYYRLDGTVEQRRLRNRLFNDLQVVLSDRNGKLIQRQVWRFSSGNDGKLLRQIHDLHNGVAREIRLHPDGKTPSTITVGRVEKTFRRDGTLEKVVDRNAGTTRRYTVEDNIRENLPDSYFVDPPHEETPETTPE